ncbi:MAG TPA: thioredoxin domain-containing protein, partial [Desulfomonilia bacterium]|nr:thioredoxin domain-containing protein [Desulfomonilia bacterium]
FIRQTTSVHPGSSLDPQLLDRTYAELKNRFNPVYGGFGPAPVFPMPHHIMFLLRHFRRTNDREALDMAVTTLVSMRAGGIYDHVGYGFHRYSTDEQWLVPHFEKMLYDQALMAIAYTEAYQVTGRSDFRKTAEETLTYVLRELRTPEGLFAAAQDADSEAGEGRYYVWTVPEVRSVLGDRDFTIARDLFGLRDEGNFAEGSKDGLNIIHTKLHDAHLIERLGLKIDALADKSESILEKLRLKRSGRKAPFKDYKALTDWNGLMIASLAKAGAAFGSETYTDAAMKAAEFLLNTMVVKGTLKHVYLAGTARLEGGIDDYSFFIWGLIELYESTFKPHYLKAAMDLNTAFLKSFRDSGSGGFFSTSVNEAVPIARIKTATDNAIPSGNSVAMLNLLRLAGLTGETALRDLAADTGKAFSGLVDRIPSAHTFMMCALDLMTGPSFEVVIAGEPDRLDTCDMISAVRGRFLPNAVFRLKPPLMNEEEPSFLQGKTPIGNRSTAYVCTDLSCRKPTTDIKKMLEYLSS